MLKLIPLKLKPYSYSQLFTERYRVSGPFSPVIGHSVGGVSEVEILGQVRAIQPCPNDTNKGTQDRQLKPEVSGHTECA